MPLLYPDNLLRRWQILRIIPRYPLSMTTQDIHEQLGLNDVEVTKRTVERDLLELAELFPIAADMRNKAHVWSWQSDAAIFGSADGNPDRALALMVIEKQLDWLAKLPESTGVVKPDSLRQGLSRFLMQHFPDEEDVKLWLPKTVAWAKTLANQIQLTGQPLDEAQLQLAYDERVTYPGAIRVLEVDRLPAPKPRGLERVLFLAGILDAERAGLTLGYFVMVCRDQKTPQQLAHEFRWVAQYEDAGGIEKLLSELIAKRAEIT